MNALALLDLIVPLLNLSHSPKMLLAARKARANIAVCLAVWLCAMKESLESGGAGAELLPEALDVYLQLRKGTAARVLQALEACAVLSADNLPAPAGRSGKSGKSTERVRRHRERLAASKAKAESGMEEPLAGAACETRETFHETQPETHETRQAETGSSTNNTRAGAHVVNNNLNNKYIYKNSLHETHEMQAAAGAEGYVAASGRRICGERFTEFEKFWRAFDLPCGKTNAADAWLDIPGYSAALAEDIIHAAGMEASHRPAKLRRGQNPIGAARWLGLRRWEDYERRKRPAAASAVVMDAMPAAAPGVPIYERHIRNVLGLLAKGLEAPGIAIGYLLAHAAENRQILARYPEAVARIPGLAPASA